MFATLTTLAQDFTYTYGQPPASAQTSGGGMSPILGILWFVVAVLIVVSVWKIYRKANRPGWAAIVPVYNDLQMLWTVGRPWWWILLMMIPVVNIVLAVIIMNDLAKSFGKGVGTTILLFLLPFIGFPMLAFGKATYLGPSALKVSGSDTPATPANPAGDSGKTPPTSPVAE